MQDERYRRKAQKWYADRFYRNRIRTHRPRQIVLGRLLFDSIRPNSVVDMGCGIGSYLEAALASGVTEICGLEYSHDAVRPYLPDSVAPHVRFGDAGKPVDPELHDKFDCAVSFEVAEHLPPESSSVFARNLADLSTDLIVLTAAPPGQIGTGHINLRPRSYWIAELARHARGIDHELTARISRLWKAAPGRPRLRYLARNLMIFRPS